MPEPSDPGPFKGPPQPNDRPPLKLVDAPVNKGGLGLMVLSAVLLVIFGGFRWQEYKKASEAESVLSAVCTERELSEDQCDRWTDKVLKPCLKRHWVHGGKYEKSFLDEGGFKQCALKHGGRAFSPPDTPDAPADL